MKRRQFIKGLAAAGAAVSSSTLTLNQAMAQGADRFWVFINASGGWDTTQVCDPKGNTVPYSEERGAVNRFDTADIRQLGNIRYAPYPSSIEPDTDWLDVFFRNHYHRLTVFNGVNYQTNSHSTGRRKFFTGSSEPTMPVTAALVAAPYGASQPMAFYDGGGVNTTGGVVSASRLSDTSLITRLTTPNPYMPSEIFDDIKSTGDQQLQGLINSAVSENTQDAMEKFQDARLGNQGLDQLLSRMPANPSGGLKFKAEIAAAAFASGLSTSANMDSGGFDTHNDHDRRQTNALGTFLEGIDHLWSELERQGISDRTTVVIGGDFSRTPYYNDRAGKDHWSVGSIMAMGAGVPGNRVIGASDHQFKARKINPNTLQLDDNGVYLTPGHINKSLRRLAGLTGSALDREFPLAVDELNLFG